MFDIVVCSSSSDLMNRSIKIINRAFISNDFDYRIEKFNEISQKLVDIIKNDKKKIYIIDDTLVNIINLIRENDFVSIIILISSHDKIDIKIVHNKLLVLDYVCLDKYFEEYLIKDINMGLKILFRDNIFVFTYNYVIYRISYGDINYIEKEPNIKRCIVHTIDKNYYVINSIEKLSNSLNGLFIKSSQSCIINMMNVSYVDCCNNMVYFKNGDKTSLITDKIKKIIKYYIK